MCSSHVLKLAFELFSPRPKRIRISTKALLTALTFLQLVIVRSPNAMRVDAMLDYEKSLIFLRDSKPRETRERARENFLLRVDAHPNRSGKRKINFSIFPGGDFAHSLVYLVLLSLNIYIKGLFIV